MVLWFALCFCLVSRTKQIPQWFWKSINLIQRFCSISTNYAKTSSPLACSHWCPTPSSSLIHCCCSRGGTSSWRLCSHGVSLPEWSTPSPASPHRAPPVAIRWWKAGAGVAGSNLSCWSVGGHSLVPSSGPYGRMLWSGCQWSNLIPCPACPSMDTLEDKRRSNKCLAFWDKLVKTCSDDG